MYYQIVLLSLLVCVNVIVSDQTVKHLNQCSGKVRCSECIRTSNCAWCYDTEFKGVRCFNPSMVKDGTGGCDVKSIYNPDNLQVIEPVNNKELSRARIRKESYVSEDSSEGSGANVTVSEYGDTSEKSVHTTSATVSKDSSTSERTIETTITTDNGNSSASEESTTSVTDTVISKNATKHIDTSATNDLVQLKPQKVQLKLRKGETLKLKFAYSQAQDYPVDLYYLMDLSNSMVDDKQKLSTLGKLLSSTMKNITSNFRIGFGSFVEKVVMPYVSMIPKNLISPCEQCAAPYGFKNQMSLSSDTDIFDEAVKNSSVSGNMDAPEGGFDALMQAIVCEKEIGWRDNARRLLIFSTDESSHFAGDGKLGGIVKPNDGECHMENHIYTHSDLQDYPSISQINNKVTKHSVNIIFAVPSKQLNVYNQLKNLIQGSVIGVLSDDSSNIIDLVQDQYNQITSSVEMNDNSSDVVQITYYSSCLGQSSAEKTNKCDGLKTGNVVEFMAEITLKECPKDPKKWKQIFAIQPVGVSESLIVELEMHCDCPCRRPGHDDFNQSSSVCNDMGTLECGVCICIPGRLGEKCQCSIEDVSEHESGCRPSNSTSGPLCSNRGNCICGQCECNKMTDTTKEISGLYCECDNFSCDINNNKICSGPDQGKCICGRCECAPEYAGSACQSQCPSSNETCISPENGEICSGNGKCECGKCVCNSNKEQYYGEYCKCLTCSGSCASFKDCVLCEVHKKGPLYDTDTSPSNVCGNCSLSPVIEEGQTANESNVEHKCTFYDDDGCMYMFQYSYDQKQHLTIRTQGDLQCPQKVDTLTIVLSVIGCVVVPGLILLLVWKIATLIHDKREFAKFEKERTTAEWNREVNPLYKQPTSTFSNPSYEQVCN